jgi:hypothetical protein
MRSLRHTVGVLTASLFLTGIGAGSASGQITIGVTNAFTIGGHSATEAGLEVSPAYSVEGLVGYKLSPTLMVFGGYARTSFGCSGGFCVDRDLTISGTHGLAGVELSRGAPWARIGLLYGKTTIGDADDSESGIGVRAGLGASFGGSVQFRPGISVSIMDASTAQLSGNATAFSFEMGVLVPIG